MDCTQRAPEDQRGLDDTQRQREQSQRQHRTDLLVGDRAVDHRLGHQRDRDREPHPDQRGAHHDRQRPDVRSEVAPQPPQGAHAGGRVVVGSGRRHGVSHLLGGIPSSAPSRAGTSARTAVRDRIPGAPDGSQLLFGPGARTRVAAMTPPDPSAPQVRAAIANIPAYVPGKPPAVRPGVTTYKLSSNENPNAPLPGVLEAAAAAAATMNRYPDMGCTALYAGPQRAPRACRASTSPPAPARSRCSTTCSRPSARAVTRSSTPGAPSRPTRSRSRSPERRRCGCRSVPAPGTTWTRWRPPSPTAPR